MSTRHVLCPAIALLCASVGTAIGQAEHQKPAVTTPPARVDAPRAEAAASAPIFDYVSHVRGYNVVNPASESVGSVEDLIIDRGSGRVEYVLIKSGGVLGIGGKTIAVPFASLSAPAVKDRRFSINMTKEQAEQAAEFVPENWSELRRDAWADRMDASRSRDRRTNDPDTDPTATAIAAAMEEALGGEVVAVRREWVDQTEDVTVQLRTRDGATRDLQLGPSWWVMGQPGAPRRGDKFEARVRVITKDGANPRYIVSNATVDGKTLVLRDSQFRPLWDRTGAEPRPGDSRPAGAAPTHSRLVLASEIVGATTVALDKATGEIHDAIMDVRSGTVVALCVDPNDSTLGWGDTIRCIPWSVATFGADERVYIDADQRMLTAAPEAPEDFNTQSSTWASSLHSTFGVPAPRYDRSRSPVTNTPPTPSTPARTTPPAEPRR